MAWREALTAMRPTGEPCPGISATVWPALRDRALDFLEQHGPQAIELGWMVTDLFGVHPRLGTRRVDHAGALAIGAGSTIEGFDADYMRKRPLTYSRNAQIGMPTGRPGALRE